VDERRRVHLRGRNQLKGTGSGGSACGGSIRQRQNWEILALREPDG